MTSRQPARKNAQIWEIKIANKRIKNPIVKIEGTIYYTDGKRVYETDASNIWKGVVAPKGARMLAVIKVPKNDTTSAMWALKKWMG
jgi:hypothetical protein